MAENERFSSQHEPDCGIPKRDQKYGRAPKLRFYEQPPLSRETEVNGPSAYFKPFWVSSKNASSSSGVMASSDKLMPHDCASAAACSARRAAFSG